MSDDLSEKVKDHTVLMSKCQNEMYLRLNAAMERVPSSFDERWDFVCDPKFEGGVGYERSRHGLEDMAFDGKTFTATHVFDRFEPMEVPARELTDLVQSWRDRGWDDLADLITSRWESDGYEDGEVVNIIDEIGRTVTHRNPVEIVDPIFVKYAGADINPMGLAMMMTVEQPYSSAKITGLEVMRESPENNI